MVASLFPIHLHDVAVKKRGKAIFGPATSELFSDGPTIVIGPNGAGKTTMLRLIHGLERASKGHVTFGLDDGKAIYQSQCFVFQKPIMLRRSALDNVAYPLILHGMKKQTARQRALDAIRRVGLEEVAETRATFLSGGEAQKIAIARALVTEPELLILDEPTASLDASSMQDIERLILKAASQGIEIIMTTHHMGQARRLAKRIIFLHQGRLIEVSDAEEFWDKPQSDEAQRFINGEIV